MTTPRAQLRLETPSGFVVDTFKSATCKDSYLEPLGSLELTIEPPRELWNEHFLLLTKGEEVRFYVNGACQGRFLIMERKSKIDEKGGLTMSLQCQTLLATASEADVDPDTSVGSSSSAPIEPVILKAMAPYFTSIITDARAHVAALSGKPIGGPPPPFTVSDLKAKAATAHEKETKQAYVNKLITRLGCVMRVDGEGNLLIGTPNFTQTSSWSLWAGVTPSSVDPSFDVFYGDVELVETNKGQFSQARVIGQAQQQTVKVGTESPPAGSFQQSRPKPPAILAVDVLPPLCCYSSTVHPLKEMIYKDKHAQDGSQATNSAMLVMGVHAAKAYVVTGTVDGWTTKAGAVWTVDTQGRLRVDPWALDATFWVEERELHMDDKGEWTKLKLIPSGALILGQQPGAT